MNHCLTCSAYESVPSEINWEEIKGIDKERQFEIAQKAKTRQKLRRIIIDNYKAGHPQNPPGSRAAVEQCNTCILFVLHFWNTIY